MHMVCLGITTGKCIWPKAQEMCRAGGYTEGSVHMPVIQGTCFPKYTHTQS